MDKDTLYYFIGIKGSGMSALALILHDQGLQVAGSDIDEYTFTQKPLAAAGIPMYSFDAANIKPGMTVIRGNAFNDDQVEVAAALALGDQINLVTYPDMVENLVKQFTSIGVAGAHGKTSTTGLLAHVLAGIAPTSYLIGDGTGKGVPDARFFIFEADEYRRHFQDYTPDYAIMTNIDFDHPDYLLGVMMNNCARCKLMCPSISMVQIQKLMIFTPKTLSVQQLVQVLTFTIMMSFWVTLKSLCLDNTVS